MRSLRSLLTFPGLAFLALAAGASAAEPPAPTISVDEVERGQRGYGLSVFAGSEPVRFDVEVLGVMRNVSPGVSHILARLSGQGLETSGVISGMSGSPVYIDGRLAGAVAFGWGFSREAIAGITPIEEMRRIPHTGELAAANGEAGGAAGGAPLRQAAPAGDLAEIDFASLAYRRFPPDLLERELAQLRPALAAGATSAVQWSASGFGTESGGLLARALGSLSLAGKAQSTGKASGPGGEVLQPGQMVGAVLIEGDLQLAATGTITDRTGDEILVFGHAFLGSGPVSLPLATAEVVTVVDSLNSSFKLSNFGPIAGAFTQDRRAGLAGRIGARAPMIPLEIRILGENSRSYEMRVAEIKEFTPALLASGLLGCLEAAAWRSGDQAIDLETTLEVRGHRPVTVRQSFDGTSAGIDSATYLLTTTAYLLASPLAEGKLDGVKLTVTQGAAPRNATLVAATPDRAVLRPGDRVRLHLDFTAYRGVPFERDLDFELPPDLPAGKLTILVGDGVSIDGARQTLAPVEPRTFAQAVDLLASLHSRRELGVLAVLPERGVAVGGQPMPRLPGSVRTLLSASAPGGATQLRSAIAAQQFEPVERPFTGLLRLDLTVERRQAVTGPDAGTPPAPGTTSGKGRP